MSGKRRRDYQAVLRALKGELERLHGEGASFDFEAVLADFEAAVCGAFRHVFPAVEMCGCNFHWGQAVFRMIQELGMQPGFQNDPGLNQYCKQILALPYLPWELIDPTLTELESEATIKGQHHLCAYVRQTWMESSVWDPASWSSFYRAILTKNDVEGRHRRLNSKAGRGQLNMYLL
ncbi:WD repeat protein [Elysia marginata]|uniref:WD repeat protein n=1 Tax=Elysia marginata TaxID=1093978 RepID=A0AAV4IEZ6_9GAST|nr:WD repeat protein [Elysia marginata]